MSIATIEATLRDGLSAWDELGKVVKFDCGADGVIVIDARTPPAVLSAGDVAAADCTLEVSADVLQRILDHELDPTGAFMTGKLRVHGDMGVAMQLASVLG
jgi:putative sterol carrier protein